jgi:hypothetical protein
MVKKDKGDDVKVAWSDNISACKKTCVDVPKTVGQCHACSGAGTAPCQMWQVYPRSNRTNSNPGVNDDVSAGYKFGDTWYNTSTGKWWKCNDPTNGAAAWDQLN